MIEDHEENRNAGQLIHVTKETGYNVPDFSAVAKAYNIEKNVIEIRVGRNVSISPRLLKGKPCQDLSPELERGK